MERVRERELDAVDVDRAALVGPRKLRLVDALLAEPAAQLDEGDDRAAVLAREVDRVADMVAVAVRDGDHVDPLGLQLALRALGVAVQERVDVDPLASGGVDPEGRVAEPGERRVRHRSPFARWPAS